MGRVLVMARATVAAEHEAAYLAAIGRRIDRLEARGGHGWVFRHRTDPRQFLEFAEGPGPDSPLGAGPDDRALDRVARYAPGRDEVWDELKPR